MNKDIISDELRRVDAEVVEGERHLAEQEALVISLRQYGEDAARALDLLDTLRQNQQRRQLDRQRLLSLLQP